MRAPSPQLDHLVIGVRDLDTAEGLVRAKGFRISGGGSHPGFGTENRLVRFGSEYLELIRVADQDAARAAGRGTLVDRLAAGDEGFVAFALRGIPVPHVIERAAAAGIDVRGPIAMSRRSTTGAAAAWRLAIPHGDQYGKWWPFFIEWADGGPGSAGYRVVDHPNGAAHVSTVTVGTADLVAVRALLEDALGMRPDGRGREIRYRLGHTLLRFVETASERDHGDGLGGVSRIRIAADPRAARFAADPPAPEWLRRIEVAGRAAPPGGVRPP